MNKNFAYIKPEPVEGAEIIDPLKINPGTYNESEFVIIKSIKDFQPILNIKVDSDYSPTFKQAEIIDNLVVIGYGDQFLIFNYITKELKANKVFNGYFSEFKIFNNKIFVATESELICFNMKGEQEWLTENLGIDGVRIKSIDDIQIKGIGEWDPPGGWKDFVLDIKTGKIASANHT